MKSLIAGISLFRENTYWTIYSRFYVGCDLCNNWFHGDCVGITEEMAKSLSEFVCNECTHARESQELYCLCKQPYDESQ